MMYQSYKEYEQEKLNYFKQIIEELPLNMDWEIEEHVKSKSRLYRYEADAVIKKNGVNYAIVEFRQSRKELPKLIAMLRATAAVFKCNRAFIVYEDEFSFIDTLIDTDYINLLPLDKSIIKQYLLNDFDEAFNKDSWKKFFNEISENLPDGLKNKDKVKNALLKIVECETEISDNRILIPEDIEEDFFESLVEEYKGKYLCRFSSFGSLFRSINEQKQSMCSIVCMNDKSEVNYVSNYLQKQGYIQSKLHPGTVGDANQSFILSCCDSKKKDNLTMMRLYADDAKGVVICYKILNPSKLKSSSNFILKKINYQRNNGLHPELDLIGSILIKKFGNYYISFRGLLKWSHFFKPKEYADEEEVRLLYTDQGNKTRKCVEGKWIHDNGYNILAQIRLFDISSKGKAFPFVIESIILGPKMKESIINQSQLDSLIKDKDIKIVGGNGPSLVDISPIDHYR